MGCFRAKKVVWSVGLAVPVVCTLLLLSGCDTETYPEDMTYPPRTDPMVTGNSDKEQAVLDTPGEYPHNLAALAANTEQRSKLGLSMLLPGQVEAANRNELNQLLAKNFGTPAHPKVDGISA